ncbi:hypothetical protein AB4Z54_22385 [Streptomyces sp. MCAF7]
MTTERRYGTTVSGRRRGRPGRRRRARRLRLDHDRGTVREFVLDQIEDDREGELMAALKATALRSARTVLTSRATA